MKAKKQIKPAERRPPSSSKRRTRPAFLYEDGKPTSVVIDIKQYKKMLERLEDLEDLAYLEEMRHKPLKFRPFEEFLAEHEGR